MRYICLRWLIVDDWWSLISGQCHHAQHRIPLALSHRLQDISPWIVGHNVIRPTVKLNVWYPNTAILYLNPSLIMLCNIQLASAEDSFNRESWKFHVQVCRRIPIQGIAPFISPLVHFNQVTCVHVAWPSIRNNLRLVASECYKVVLMLNSLTFSLLFKLIWLSPSVGSVLRYWDLGGAMLVSSCWSANTSLSFSWRTLTSLAMRLPMR